MNQYRKIKNNEMVHGREIMIKVVKIEEMPIKEKEYQLIHLDWMVAHIEKSLEMSEKRYNNN